MYCNVMFREAVIFCWSDANCFLGHLMTYKDTYPALKFWLINFVPLWKLQNAYSHVNIEAYDLQIGKSLLHAYQFSNNYTEITWIYSNMMFIYSDLCSTLRTLISLIGLAFWYHCTKSLNWTNFVTLSHSINKNNLEWWTPTQLFSNSFTL